MNRRRFLFLALIVLLLAIASLTPWFPRIPEPGSGSKQDAFCAELLRTKDHREARQWIREATSSSPRIIGEQSPEDSRAIVEELYRMGAVDVQAVEIAKVPRFGETTNTLVVTLPRDPAARAALFRFEAKTARGEGFDPVSDDGQCYMFLWKFKLSIGQVIRLLLGRARHAD